MRHQGKPLGRMMQGELTGGRVLQAQLDRLRAGAWICHTTSHIKSMRSMIKGVSEHHINDECAEAAATSSS